jgi:hypothetical protein
MDCNQAATDLQDNLPHHKCHLNNSKHQAQAALLTVTADGPTLSS